MARWLDRRDRVNGFDRNDQDERGDRRDRYCHRSPDRQGNPWPSPGPIVPSLSTQPPSKPPFNWQSSFLALP